MHCWVLWHQNRRSPECGTEGSHSASIYRPFQRSRSQRSSSSCVNEERSPPILRLSGCFQQRAFDGYLRELHFVGVAAERSGAVAGEIRGLRDIFRCERFSVQGFARFCSRPRCGSYVSKHNRRLADVRSLHPDRDRSGHQRPIQRFFLPDFVRRVLHAMRGWHVDFRQDFVGQQRRFARHFILRTDEEFLRRDHALSGSRNQLHLRAERDRSRTQARRTDEIRRSAAEDRVIAIVAVRNQALAVLHGEQSEAAPVIPATGTLAQVAADRSHVADLRTRDAHHRAVQRRKFAANGCVGSKFIERHRRANAQPLPGSMDSAKLLHAFDVHQTFGSVDEILHQADLICAAGENVRFAPLGAKQRQRLVQRCRICVFEGLHYAILLSSVASTRSAVSGTRGTRTPIALATAFAMAAMPPMAHGSPNPMTPRLSFSSRMSMWTISSPMSPIPASL